MFNSMRESKILPVRSNASQLRNFLTDFDLLEGGFPGFRL